MERKEFVERVAQEMKRRPLSLFLGAGIGADAGLPTWNSLFEAFRSELGIEEEAAVSNPLLAQYYANEKGGSLQSAIRKHIEGKVIPSRLLINALDLDPTNIWTLDYDQVIERTLEKQGETYSVVYSEADLSTVYPNDRITIYKLGGEITSLSDALVTKDSFEEFESSHQLFEAFLRKELVTNTFLFLGYSFEDGIAQRSLKLIANALGRTANVHYNIMKKSIDNPNAQRHFLTDLEKRYRVQTLLVDGYDEIQNVLQDIRAEVSKNRVFISGSLWAPENAPGNPYEICKKVALGLIEKDITVVSGLGFNIGYYISGAISEYCFTRGLRVENHLILNPYSHDCSPEDEFEWRKRLIDSAHAVIFLFGQSMDKRNNPISSRGVLEEYEIARKLNKPIIPLGSTGFASQRILNEAKRHPENYAYLDLDKTLPKFEREIDPDELAKLVMRTLDNIRLYQGANR